MLRFDSICPFLFTYANSATNRNKTAILTIFSLFEKKEGGLIFDKSMDMLPAPVFHLHALKLQCAQIFKACDT